MTRKRDPIIAKSISCRIKNLRKKRFPGPGGQTKCADSFGATQGKWSKWESGAAIPTDLDQRRLSEFFGISLAELRGDTSPAALSGDERSVEISRLVIHCMEIQESLAVFVRELVAGGFSDAPHLEAELQETLRRIRDVTTRARAFDDEADQEADVS